MTLQPTCRVSTKGLSDAIAERLKYPGRTEAQAVNTAAYWIAVNTKNETPFASIEAMDESLDRFTIPKSFMGPTGQITYRGKKTFYGRIGQKTKAATGKEVPLAALIIAARVGKTNIPDKWQLTKNPFKGVSRARGASAMRRLVEKMVKGRHSSAHFLQSGWVKVVRILRQYAKGGSPPGANQDASFDYDFSTRGDATVAKEGATMVFAQVINDTGAEGVNAVKVDEALHRYGQPPLEAAFERERTQLLKRVEELQKAQNEKFNQMAK